MALRTSKMRSVPATEAENNFGAILAQAQHDPVLIESRGLPTAVLMSVETYEALELVRLANERRKALERLRAIRADAERRNADLTQEEAAALVEEIVDEIFSRMMAEDTLRFDE